MCGFAEEAVAHGVLAAGYRAEAERLLETADFHSAISRAFLRDWLEQQASEGDPPAAPVRRDTGRRRGKGVGL